MAKYRCPRCGSTHLNGNAIVSQWWSLDEDGNRIDAVVLDETESIDDYIMTEPIDNKGLDAMFCRDCECLGSANEFKVPEKKDNTIHTLEVARDIVELFEDLLDKHNMIIPDDDRVGDDGEAAIYGMTYGDLLYSVEEIILSTLEQHNINTKIIKSEFCF